MSNQEEATELTSPTANPLLVEKLAEWLLKNRPWAYTGHKSTLSNAKPKHIWVQFYEDTAVWWFEQYRFAREGPTAGAKGPAYTLFRDSLPDALRLFRSRKEGKPLDEIEPVVCLYRKNEYTKDGQPAVRAVKGFGRLPTNYYEYTQPAQVAQVATQDSEVTENAPEALDAEPVETVPASNLPTQDAETQNAEPTVQTTTAVDGKRSNVPKAVPHWVFAPQTVVTAFISAVTAFSELV